MTSTFSCDIAYSRSPAASRGLVAASEELGPRDPPVAKREEDWDPTLDFGTTSAPTSDHVHRDDYVISGVEEVVGLEGDPLRLTEQFALGGSNPLEPAMRADIPPVMVLVLDVGVVSN